MKIFRILFTLSFITSLLFAGGKDIANKLELKASTKAISQWEKVFTDDKKMEKLGISALSIKDKALLKEYLLKNAVDSDHAEAAGIEIDGY